MGGVVGILSHSRRRTLSTGACSLALLLAYMGDMLVMLAIYIKFSMEARVAIVLGNHTGALPYFLMAVGMVTSCVCTAASKMSNDAGFLETATYRTCRMLLFTLVCQGLTLVLLLAAAVLCLVHQSLMRGVLHDGFMTAIKLYRVNDHVKTGLNRIQSRFQCCGSRSMQDWFKTPWISMNYLNVDHPDVARSIVDGEFITDDAPYSCCDVHVSRPCVHHQVQNLSAHRMLGPGGTLYTTGCSQRLEDFWKANVLNPLLCFLILMALFMVVSMMLSRLLQTSLRDALDKGDPTADGKAFWFGFFPCTLSSSTADDTQRRHQTGGDGGDRPGGGMVNASQNHSSNMNQSGLGSRPGHERAGDGGGNDHRGISQGGGTGDGQDLKTSTPHTSPCQQRGRGFCREKTARDGSRDSHRRDKKRRHSVDRIGDCKPNRRPEQAEKQGYRQVPALNGDVGMRSTKPKEKVRFEDEPGMKKKMKTQRQIPRMSNFIRLWKRR